ncbi:hypothetical protein [Niveibacterium sp. COAC-50]|uniref:hypothetical protein n=1 Tax=Niveibacterium sp. COAC-50 TaxID=2729384 RepID=UPI001555BB9A|nr:hypothetical protein [Niveibacterium sp. COAC-50]
MKLPVPSLSVLLAFCLCLFLCPPSMAQEVAETTQTIFVDRELAKPKPMYYFGPGGGAALMFGALGAAAVEKAMTPAQAIQRHAEDNGVFIERIVLEALLAELKKSGRGVVTEGALSVDSMFKLEIQLYGFSIPHGFSSKLVPVLSVSCAVFGKNGDRVATRRGYVGPLGNPADGVDEAELKDPAVIERLWTIAAQAAVQKIMAANVGQGSSAQLMPGMPN